MRNVLTQPRKTLHSLVLLDLNSNAFITVEACSWLSAWLRIPWCQYNLLEVVWVFLTDFQLLKHYESISLDSMKKTKFVHLSHVLKSKHMRTKWNSLQY